MLFISQLTNSNDYGISYHRFGAVSPFPSCFSRNYTLVRPVPGIAQKCSDPTPTFSVDCALFTHFPSQKSSVTLLESVSSALFEKQRRGVVSRPFFLEHSATMPKSFRMRLYAQHARNPFRMRFYENHPGGVPLFLPFRDRASRRSGRLRAVCYSWPSSSAGTKASDHDRTRS